MSPRTQAPKTPSWKALFLVELVCPVALEVIPPAFAFYSSSYVPFASAWCAWSLVIMAAYCIIYSLCKLLCYRWPRAAAVFAHVAGEKYSIDYRRDGIEDVQTPTDETSGRVGTVMPIWGVTGAISRWFAHLFKYYCCYPCLGKEVSDDEKKAKTDKHHPKHLRYKNCCTSVHHEGASDFIHRKLHSPEAQSTMGATHYTMLILYVGCVLALFLMALAFDSRETTLMALLLVRQCGSRVQHLSLRV